MLLLQVMMPRTYMRNHRDFAGADDLQVGEPRAVGHYYGRSDVPLH